MGFLQRGLPLRQLASAQKFTAPSTTPLRLVLASSAQGLPKASMPARLSSSSASVSAAHGRGHSTVLSDPMTGEPTGHHDIDASALIIEENKTLREPPPSSSLVFGHSFADHMLAVNWNGATGWAAPRIQPYGPLTLDPSSVIFHYAPSLFEGMKAYKDVEGRVRLFRPDMNMKRMNTSAERMALPVSSALDIYNPVSHLPHPAKVI